MKENKMKKEQSIVLMGTSKPGKTSFIYSLSHDPKKTLSMYAKQERRETK